jgi:hypothetical protein
MGQPETAGVRSFYVFINVGREQRPKIPNSMGLKIEKAASQRCGPFFKEFAVCAKGHSLSGHIFRGKTLNHVAKLCGNPLGNWIRLHRIGTNLLDECTVFQNAHTLDVNIGTKLGQ